MISDTIESTPTARSTNAVLFRPEFGLAAFELIYEFNCRSSLLGCNALLVVDVNQETWWVCLAWACNPAFRPPTCVARSNQPMRLAQTPYNVNLRTVESRDEG